jgi:putative hydrolase of the HAD superfamily
LEPIPRPRAVLFDLFDTLVRAISYEAGVPTTWDDLGIPLEAWQRRWFDNRDGRATGRITDPLEALRVVVHDIDPTIPVEKIAWANARRLRRFEDALTEPAPAFVDAVARVRAAGIRTALVSNAVAGEVEAWPRSPFAQHFDTALFSCHVGTMKPERAIYDEALARVGVPASAALFVGDGNSDEHRGARAAGISTVLVTRLAGDRWAHAMDERRALVDWTFDDVPAFVEALEL